jgi:hypothetical protein
MNELYLTEKNPNATTTRFKVVVLYKKQEHVHIFRAITLEDLAKQVQDEFPGGRILSAIGGGQ